MSERRTFNLPGESPDGKPSGLVCRVCGCQDFRVANSYPFTTSGKLRRRQCRHCGLIVVTQETIVQNPGGNYETT